MRFRAGNKIKYSQDFQQWIGLPSDVDFTVQKIDDNSVRLTAPGYGGKPYGNGAIYVYKSMQKG